MANKPKAPTQDYAAARLQKLVSEKPLARDQAVALPEVKAPNLDDLKVEVQPVGAVTEDELIARFQELRREHAQKRDRAHGELLAPGDDVKLDVLGYHDGKLIPFSVRMGEWAVIAPSAELPGFFEVLAGNPLGDGLELELTMSPQFPVEALRGQPARFLVDVREAREVTLPEEDDAAFLAALGRGATLEEVMLALREELEEEHAEVQALVVQEAVLDALAARTEVTLPRALVDDEITRRWNDSEGRSLEARKFLPDERQESLNAWLADAATRADAERRLRISLALGAVARAANLQLDAARLKALVAEVGAQHGVSAEQSAAALSDSHAATEKMAQAAWHLIAVEHVMSKAQITVKA